MQQQRYWRILLCSHTSKHLACRHEGQRSCVTQALPSLSAVTCSDTHTEACCAAAALQTNNRCSSCHGMLKTHRARARHPTTLPPQRAAARAPSHQQSRTPPLQCTRPALMPACALLLAPNEADEHSLVSLLAASRTAAAGGRVFIAPAAVPAAAVSGGATLALLAWLTRLYSAVGELDARADVVPLLPCAGWSSGAASSSIRHQHKTPTKQSIDHETTNPISGANCPKHPPPLQHTHPHV